MNSAVFEYICAWSKKENEFLCGAVNTIRNTFKQLLDIVSTYPMQILQLGIKQNNNKVQQKLYGVTHFSRIQMPISSDPLNGMFQIVYLQIELILICILSSLFFLVLTERYSLGRLICDCIRI